MLTILRRFTAFALSTLALGVISIVMASPASADSIYNPAVWNNRIIYLSRACHDGNDGVPGGACIPNTGCNNFNENAQSNTTSLAAANGRGPGDNLVERGYKVHVGTGTAGQNIASSNAARATLHIPLHTNSGAQLNCSSTTAANHGTWGMFASANGQNCASSLVNRVGQASPGTNDITQRRNDLGELTRTTAIGCYLEAEFHSWSTGVTWIRDEINWTWRIGWAVDSYLGYP